jgi:hypothetical protein
VVETVVEYIEVEKVIEVRDIEVDIISVQTEVYQNTPFSVKVNITNPFGPVVVDTYSYVYNGSKCVSGGWTANKRTIELVTNYTTVAFNNTVGSEGLFKLKVRLKHNDTNYDSHPIELLVKELKFSNLSISAIRYGNSTLHLTVTNSGNIGTNATLIADSLGINVSFYMAAGETIPFDCSAESLDSPATVLLFSENMLHTSTRLTPPSLVSFAIASTVDLENFLFAVLSTVTLAVLGVAIWKR